MMRAPAVSDLPRLLLCCFDVVPAPTAISRRLTEYVKGLSERYQVVVLSVKTPDHTHIERYQGARLLRVPVGAGDLAARAQAFDRAVRRQLDSEEYVLVHCFDPFGGYALAERRSEFGYKLIYDACTLPSVELPFVASEAEANRRFLAKVRRQELFCLMNADAVVVGSELTRDYVCGLGVAREQVHLLPAPVDLGPYQPAVMGQPDATPMTLIHLGHQGACQDLPTVLEALQLALQTVDVRLAVVGPKHAEHQARLEELVAERKLTGKVDFQPPVAHDDLHKVLATADVGLLTLSEVERNSVVGSPLSRLGEYLAAGRPVIAADVPSARAQLPEDGAVLYRPGDAASLADAIVTLATDPARRVKLGAAARRGASDRDAVKVRADLVAIYVGLSGAGVRAVGDDDARPDEVTQLGVAASASSDTSKQRRVPGPEADSTPGAAKGTTDPAIATPEGDTSPEGDRAARAPAVMGVPLRDETPRGPAAQALARELAEQVTTEPNAARPSEPPVVMGSPLPRDAAHDTAGPTPGDLAAELDDVATTGPIVPPPTLDLSAPAAVTPRSGAADEAVPAATAPVSAPVPETTAPPAAGPPESRPDDEVPAVLGVEEPADAGADEEAPAVLGTLDTSSLPDEPAPVIPLLTLEPFAAAATAPSRPPAPLPPVPPLAELAPPPRARNPLEELAEDPQAPRGPTAPAAGVTSATKPGVAVGPVPSSTGPTRPSTVGTDPLTPLAGGGASAARPGAGAETAASPASSSSHAVPATVAGPGASEAVASPAPPGRTGSGAAPALAALSSAPAAAGRGAPAPLAHAASGSLPLVGGPGASAPSAGPATTRTASGNFPALAVAPGSLPLAAPLDVAARPVAAAAPPAKPAAAVQAKAPGSGLFPVAPQVPGLEEAEAIDENEIVDADGEVDGEVEEISEDEVLDVPEVAGTELEDEPPLLESESIATVDTDASPPPSAIDPWLAQLAHGYCPPEANLFDRHTPPTTMPGRDP
jgi:glycosyltransferase involved in cell wall biosynthesis